MLVEEGIEARNVNGILGLLCREHFPSLVWASEDEDPVVPSFDQYALITTDTEHRNLVDRVIQELWVSLSRSDTKEALQGIAFICGASLHSCV